MPKWYIRVPQQEHVYDVRACVQNGSTALSCCGTRHDVEMAQTVLAATTPLIRSELEGSDLEQMRTLRYTNGNQLPVFDHTATCNSAETVSFYRYRGFFAWLRASTEFLGKTTVVHVELSDQDLINRMNDGDDRAFAELYNRYFDKIYAFTIRRVGHHEIAEDLVSKVFMKAFANRKGFVWKVSFSAWIYRIATNTITDHYRTKKSDIEFNPEYHDKPSTGEDTAGKIDVEILGKSLEQILEKLKERDRMVISLKFYGELSNPEIAETIGCKPEHVAVILHRALKKCEKFTPKELEEMQPGTL